MGSNIKKLREDRGLTLSDVAAKIGVSEVDLKRMERRWDDPSPTIARDLAVLLNCNVFDLTGKKPDVDEYPRWPFSVVEVCKQEFGGIYLNIAGKELAYALEEDEKGRLFSQVEGMSVAQEGADQAWLTVTTLCGRLLFLNPVAIRSLALKHDDEIETPNYLHPEVYRALYDDNEKGAHGSVLQEAVEQALAMAGEDEQLIEDQRRTKILHIDGFEDHRYLHDQWVAIELLSLDGHRPSVAANSFLHVEHEGGYVNGWINLSQVAMLDVPLEQYLRLTAPN